MTLQPQTVDASAESIPSASERGSGPSSDFLRIEHATKRFTTADGVVTALDDVSIDIRKGDVYGIIGRSGSGKSTLVRSVLGLERLDSGRILLDGTAIDYSDSRALRAFHERVGVIYQDPLLLGNQTVLDNIRLALRYAHRRRDDVDAKAAELIDYLGLQGKEKAYPAQLSGGQRQRVSIARSLMKDPSFLICDEATSALDPETTLSILGLLKRLNQELGLTILLITHQMNVVREICDTVSVFSEGRNVETASAIDVFASPRDEVTKRLIGVDTSQRKVRSIARYVNRNRAAGTAAQRYCRFVFLGDGATRPVLGEISKRYPVEVNILFGDINLVEDDPLSNIYVSISGEESQIDAALEFARGLGVSVDEIRMEQ